jgi:hypothetical protein
MTFELKENGSLRAFLNPALGKGIKSDDLSVEEYNKQVEALVADLSAGKLQFHSFKDDNGKWILGFK